MSKFKFNIIFFMLVILLFKVSCFAQDTSSYVDLSFSINNKAYYSKGVQKQLAVAPFIENGLTLVPFRAILEELGYLIEWNADDLSIVARSKSSTLNLQINNYIVKIDGAEEELPIAPKTVNGVTVVPLRFISENANSSVIWDAQAKSIYISRFKEYNTGKMILYEKKSNDNYILHYYNGEKVKSTFLEKKEVINWYTYNGKILATILDKNKSQKTLSLFNGLVFSTLVEDFDVIDTFEYNNNLLIHGYDRSQKYNKLYRFDGYKLSLVYSDFCVGKYLVFKDKLIINKYDNARNYSLLVFDKNSWTPRVLSNSFIIKDFIEAGDNVYMTGTWQQGSNISLAVYDSSYMTLSIINNNTNIDLKSAVFYRGKLYAVSSGELVSIEKSGMYKVFIPFDYITYVKYNVSKLKVYNDKLIIGTNGGKYVDYAGNTKAEPKVGGIALKILPRIIEFEDITKNKILIDNFVTMDLKTENNILLIVGTEQYTGDKVLYAYNGGYLQKASDITNIKDLISLNGKLYIKASDRDRMRNISRNILMQFDGQTFKNLAVGMETKKWTTVGDSLVLVGYEEELKTDRLYSYNGSFNTLAPNFIEKFWFLTDNTLFISGYNPVEKNNYFYKFNNKLIKVFDNIEIINMIKLKGRYYLIYAYNRDSKSPLNSKKVLYLYNDASGKFTEMKTNIELTKMIFIE